MTLVPTQVFKTLCEMLIDRGYIPPESSDVQCVICHPIQSRLPIIFIYMCQQAESQIGVKVVEKVDLKMTQLGIKFGIIVHPKATPLSVRKYLDQAKVSIECFSFDDLIFNIMKHEMMPKFETLSPDQKTTLLTELKIQETQLPRILPSDPVAKYLGMRRGDVVQIDRKSETAGKYTLYRILL